VVKEKSFSVSNLDSSLPESRSPKGQVGRLFIRICSPAFAAIPPPKRSARDDEALPERSGQRILYAKKIAPNATAKVGPDSQGFFLERRQQRFRNCLAQDLRRGSGRELAESLAAHTLAKKEGICAANDEVVRSRSGARRHRSMLPGLACLGCANLLGGVKFLKIARQKRRLEGCRLLPLKRRSRSIKQGFTKKFVCFPGASPAHIIEGKHATL